MSNQMFERLVASLRGPGAKHSRKRLNDAMRASRRRAFETLEERIVLSFTTPTNFSVGLAPEVVTVGDFNGDGNPDLATANSFPNTVSVRLGNGAGSFGTVTNLALAVGSKPYSVTVGDFNGDGKPDLATANYGTNNVSVLLGNGAGGFAAPTNFAVGTGGAVAPPVGDGPVSVTVEDFNGDGKSDLAVANRHSFNASVLLGDGTGSFAAATNFFVGFNQRSVKAGDFNGDGKPDLAVVVPFPSGVNVLLGNGAGGFAPATSFPVGSNPASVTVEDFNGDGKPDLAVANYGSNNVGVLLGNGSGGFAAATNFAVSTPWSVTVEDFNGDGKPDLATANRNSNNVSVLLGDGTGGFAAPTNFAVGSFPKSVTVEDFNGDGKPDLAVANRGSHNVSVLLNTYAPSNVPPTITSNAAAVSANEGSTATNSGTFSDAQGNTTVTIAASIGTVTQNNGAGTWSWSLNAADGPAGPFTVTITATDNQNAAVNTTFNYAFNNVPPTIALSGNATVDEGSLYTLNLGAISDPGTDTVTAYSINWGDGPAENFIGNPANTTATHTYADGPIGYTITVTLTDEDGTVTGGSLSVIVLNVAPTAVDDAIALPENDSAQVVNVLANDSDTAGVNDPLIVTSVNIMGTTGGVTLNAGVVSYLPDGFFEALGAGETALDTFEYSISDDDGATDMATVTVTITGQNDAPTAAGTLPNFSVNQNAANSVISLTGLFADVDANDTLSITAVSSSNVLVTAGVSGNSLTLDYQANESGTATITVTATDGSGASVSLTFNVVVVSPAQQVNAFILLIEQWNAVGKINHGVGNSMIVKVENALKSYEKGNITAAGNQLNALKSEISAKVKPGALTLADATLAISLIDALYDSMTA